MATRPLIGCATSRKVVDQGSSAQPCGLLPTYSEAVLAGGGLPVLIPLNLDQEALQALLERVDAVLLPGGGDVAPAEYGGNSDDPLLRSVDTERDRVEFLLVQEALQREMPLLAICRGIQVFNVALGGTLWQDVQNMPNAVHHDYDSSVARDYLAHEITVQSDSQLAQVFGTTALGVNSFHHQGIRDLAPKLKAVATSPDGLIEAVEFPDHPFAIGVQWHPENMVQSELRMRRLFQDFVAAAARTRR